MLAGGGAGRAKSRSYPPPVRNLPIVASAICRSQEGDSDAAFFTTTEPWTLRAGLSAARFGLRQPAPLQLLLWHARQIRLYIQDRRAIQHIDPAKEET